MKLYKTVSEVMSLRPPIHSDRLIVIKKPVNHNYKHLGKLDYAQPDEICSGTIIMYRNLCAGVVICSTCIIAWL